MDEQLLIDQIYEASVVPELWPSLLESIADHTGSHGGALLAIDPEAAVTAFSGSERYKTTESYARTYQAYYESDVRYVNPRFQRAVSRRQWMFQSDLAMCSVDELRQDPIYRDFLYPMGIEWTVGCPIPVPSADIVIFDFCRKAGDNPFDDTTVGEFNRLRPHLARAAFVAARLGLDRARTATETLTAVGLPGAALRASGKVIAANPLFDRLAPRISAAAQDRLVVADARAARAVQMVFDGFNGGKMDCSHSIPIAAEADLPPLVMHLLPVRRAAAEIFASTDLLLIVTPVIAPATALAHVLEGLFDLTVAETLLARAMASGSSLNDFAAGRGISPETARKQLKTVMLKTGTHRQSDLVRLLAGAAPIGNQ